MNVRRSCPMKGKTLSEANAIENKNAYKFNFPPQPHLNRFTPKSDQHQVSPAAWPNNITLHNMKNLAFHSLLRWKMTVLPILTPHKNILFEPGSKLGAHTWDGTRGDLLGVAVLLSPRAHVSRHFAITEDGEESVRVPDGDATSSAPNHSHRTQSKSQGVTREGKTKGDKNQSGNGEERVEVSDGDATLSALNHSHRSHGALRGKQRRRGTRIRVGSRDQGKCTEVSNGTLGPWRASPLAPQECGSWGTHWRDQRGPACRWVPFTGAKVQPVVHVTTKQDRQRVQSHRRETPDDNHEGLHCDSSKTPAQVTSGRFRKFNSTSLNLTITFSVTWLAFFVARVEHYVPRY